ncbi:MAG: fibronectin type III domain-containing protein [Lachnospiraceae bacterium]|nr:fibronectin type III domain-containing protein [Lachnospiraceae bacterium]
MQEKKRIWKSRLWIGLGCLAVVLVLFSAVHIGAAGAETAEPDTETTESDTETTEPGAETAEPDVADKPENTSAPNSKKTKKEMVAEKKKVLAKMKDEGKILIRAKRLSTSKVMLTWKDADAAFSYQIYKKASGQKEKLLKTVKSGSYTVTGLKATDKYKLYIKVYYKWKGTSGGKSVSEDIYMGKSLALTVSTGGTHFMNTKKLSVKMEKVTLYKKQMYSIRTRIWLNGNKTVYGRPKLFYYSTASDVAKVDSGGLVTAKKKGTAVIFVLAPNGVYDKVYIQVKG